MKKTVLIDGNSIGYAAHYATKLTVGDLQTQAVFGFIKTLRDLKREYRGAEFTVLWDGKAQWRFDLMPEYKSNRDNDPKKAAIKEAYVQQRPYIMRALKHLGVRQLTVTTHEADDMAGYLVEQLSIDPEREIVMISGDRDWIQLVRPRVIWRDLREENRIVTIDNLMDKTGFKTPFGFLEGKCLQGDSSDCISGVGGIGEKGAPEFIAEFGSVRRFVDACERGRFKPTKKAHKNLLGTSEFTREQWADKFEGDPKSDKQAFDEHMDKWEGNGRTIFRRNFKMMQLLKVAPPESKDIQLDKGEFNKEKFSEVCAELSFVSILRNIDEFCGIFERKAA